MLFFEHRVMKDLTKPRKPAFSTVTKHRHIGQQFQSINDKKKQFSAKKIFIFFFASKFLQSTEAKLKFHGIYSKLDFSLAFVCSKFHAKISRHATAFVARIRAERA